MELIVILVLGLVVLGPQRIPEVASSLGKAIRGFRKATRELREQIDIEDEVRRPFEDLRAALRDEPAPYRPPAPLITAVGDPQDPVSPLIPRDPNYVPPGHGPVYGSPEELALRAAIAAGGVYQPGHATESLDAPGHPDAAAGAPAVSPPVAATGVASLVGPPEEPVVSANSGADHFQRAAQAASPAKGAS